MSVTGNEFEQCRGKHGLRTPKPSSQHKGDLLTPGRQGRDKRQRQEMKEEREEGNKKEEEEED